jgi:hypothetical protein
MTCRVVRLVERDRLVLLHISGHLQQVHMSMLKELIAQETDPVILDLETVTLIDQHVMRAASRSGTVQFLFANG